MRLSLVLLVLVALGVVLNAQPVTFDRVMISEVSSGDPDGVELTNYSSATVDLSNWIVGWLTPSGNSFSTPLGVAIAPGESIVVKEPGGVVSEAPPGTQILSLLPVISITDAAYTVGLRDGLGVWVDQVHVSDVSGNHPGLTFGSPWRGLAVRTGLASGIGATGFERIWGLDSNAGADWTEQPNRSFGRENRNSGPRGTDPTPVPIIVITETDDSPDYIELFCGPTVNLRDWFLLCSSVQGAQHVRIEPFPGNTIVGPNEYLVIGDGASPPAEMPAGTPYVNLSAVGGGNIPWVSSEYDVALYDDLGRLVDMMRTTASSGDLVHNHPRAPSFWADFTGAAGRIPGGDGAIGRYSIVVDTNTGADWRPVFTRTMGSGNTVSSLVHVPGHGDELDVRVNETAAGQGLAAILNGGSVNAGMDYGMFISFGHSNGVGPFLGLGPDALLNWMALQLPPWIGTLDAQGSARIDLDPGLVPAGLDADLLFVVTNPSGFLVSRTLVLEYDS